MKTSICFAALFMGYITLISSSFTCWKEKDRTSGNISGILIDTLCGNYIVSINSPTGVGNFDESLVTGSWQDPQTGNTYTNVFTVTNPCALYGKVGINEPFAFYFSDDPSAANCTFCTTSRPVPPKENKVKFLRK